MKQILATALVVIALLVLSACSSPPAPVVERSGTPDSQDGRWQELSGEYRIRRGDTLHGIAFHFGLDHRELAEWNDIRPPYLIYPDQVLRLTAPARRVIKNNQQTPGKTVKTVQREPSSETGSTQNKTVTRPPAASTETGQVAPPAKVKSAAVVAGDPTSWVWPVNGRVLRSFQVNDPARSGLDITAREGQAIMASAGGTVVYSGSGLIGFGELIIIKHSERMLSAYAHNRVRLVAEGASVKQGQKIAELGRNDRNEPMLHFEIRVGGRPVDPRKYLPDK